MTAVGVQPHATRAWLRRLIALRRDQGGQALVFAALSLFVLLSFALLVYDLDLTIDRRIEVQEAADAAAYAGALVEADALEAVSWINDGMAYIYFNAAIYTVDELIVATLAELRHGRRGGEPMIEAGHVGLHGAVRRELKSGNTPDFAGQGRWRSPIPGSPSKPEEVHDWQKELLVKEWLDRRSLNWLRELSLIERGIAAALPHLIAAEVFRVAQAGGAEQVALLPDLADGYLPRLHYLPDYPGDPLSALAYDGARALDRLPERFLAHARENQQQHSAWGEAGRTGLPAWFDLGLGRPTGAYEQIRVCDRAEDVGHTLGHGGTGWPLQGTPPGHWHRPHYHPHWSCWYHSLRRGGHWHHEGYGGCNGHHSPPWPSHENFAFHHEIVTCPRCEAGDHDGDSRADVRATREQAREARGARHDLLSGVRHPEATYQRSGGEDRFHFPLVLQSEGLRRALTVAVWKRAGPAGPPWGYLAVASAKAVTRVDGRWLAEPPVPFYDRDANLYHADHPGQLIVWGARLVSTRRAVLEQQGNTLQPRPAGEVWRALLLGTWREREGGLANPVPEGLDRTVVELLRDMRRPGGQGPFDLGGEIAPLIHH